MLFWKKPVSLRGQVIASLALHWASNVLAHSGDVESYGFVECLQEEVDLVTEIGLIQTSKDWDISI